MNPLPDFSKIFVDPSFRRESRISQAWRAGESHGHHWCHLWCDGGNEEVLHALAERIGMRREWFQDRSGFPHYDLIPSMREEAVRLGATEKRLRDWLRERKAGQGME